MYIIVEEYTPLDDYISELNNSNIEATLDIKKQIFLVGSIS